MRNTRRTCAAMQKLPCITDETVKGSPKAKFQVNVIMLLLVEKSWKLLGQQQASLEQQDFSR